MEEEKGGTLEGVEGESPTPEDKTVPLERFNEVYGQLKDVRKEIDSLKTEKNKGGLTPDQEKELQAQEYLEKLIVKTIDKKEQTTKQAQEQEQKEFESSVDSTLSLNPDVKRPEFVAFLEKEADKYGVTTVEGAMNLYKQLNKTVLEAAQKAKEDLRKKPDSLQNEGSGGKKLPDDSGKSLNQIADEAIRGLR